MTKLRIISTSVIFVGIACNIWGNAQVQPDKLTVSHYQPQILAESPFTSNDKDAPDSTISGTTRSGLGSFVRNESV